MGRKMPYDPKDPFFDIIKPKPYGICGGCYCCGQQIHLEFQYLGILPTARIDGDQYQIIICDLCEEDITHLEGEGLGTISYDILFQLQEDLREKMFEFDEYEGEVTEEIRLQLLKDLYLEYMDRFEKLKG